MVLGFFVEDTAKTDAASNSRVTIEECLVWGQISDPNCWGLYLFITWGFLTESSK
jgi:hypothetical protein